MRKTVHKISDGRPSEIAHWLQLLGNSNMRRITVIEDLLRHANGDQMSAEDQVICRQTLEKLRLLPPDVDIPEKRLIVREQHCEDEDNTGAAATYTSV